MRLPLGATMLHKNSRERYGKLKKEFRRLMQNFNVDDLDNFIATANSMRKWMEEDSTLIQEQRDALARLTVEESVDWQICNQIANRQKHVKPKRHGRPVPQVGEPEINPGGPGILLQSSARIIGAGAEIYVEYCRQRESALAFVIRLFKHFHFMFEMAETAPAQRQIPTLADLARV
jgi:hypothetical protein